MRHTKKKTLPYVSEKQFWTAEKTTAITGTERKPWSQRKHDKCLTSKICSDYLRYKKTRGPNNQICFENRITLVYRYNNIQNIRRKEIDSPKTPLCREKEITPPQNICTPTYIKKLETEDDFKLSPVLNSNSVQTPQRRDGLFNRVSDK